MKRSTTSATCFGRVPPDKGPAAQYHFRSKGRCLEGHAATSILTRLRRDVSNQKRVGQTARPASGDPVAPRLVHGFRSTLTYLTNHSLRSRLSKQLFRAATAGSGPSNT